MTTQDAHSKAVQRIQAARATGQDWLDLGDLPLEKVPLEIRQLPGLRALGLGAQRYDATTSS